MQTIVVLGMHKSGTSLVAEMLHHSGIEMSEALRGVSYDKGEKYERDETSAIDKALLNAEGLYSLHVRRKLRPESVDAALQERARSFVAALVERGTDWGFKDPRTCLTWEFWKPLLPPHKLICVFRDVDEIHRRYRWRGRFFGLRALDAWYCYNVAMLEAFAAAAPEDRLLLDYHDLMDRPDGVAALSDFLGRAIEDRRNREMRRTTGKADARTKWDAVLYRLLTGRDVWKLNRRLRALAQGSSRAGPNS